MIYADYACMGTPTERTLERLAQASVEVGLVQPGETGSDRTFRIVGYCEQAREEAARFLGVSPSNVALICNTTHGLGLLASGLRLSSKENVLLPDIEFISSALVWQRARARMGFDIRLVPSVNAHVERAQFEAMMDDQTRVIVASAVQEVSGDRLDLEALAELTSANDVFLIVDGIQEAGVLRRTLAESRVDAYVVGGHKWLGSPFGLGFMYVSDRLIDHATPAFDGYFNLREPAGGWEAYLQDRNRCPLDVHEVLREARQYEPGGMPNFLGALGLICAFEEIEKAGMDVIEQHVLSLNHRFRESLGALGLDSYILGSGDPRTHSGIVTVSLPGGIEQERLALRRLHDEEIILSLRSISGVGGLRFSFYTPTTAENVDACSAAIGRFLGRKG